MFDIPIDDTTFFKHWASLGINDIAGVIGKWVDKIFLLYLLAPGDFALFFNGSFEIPLFGLLISVVGSVMLIEMSKDFSSTAKIKQLFMESFRILSLVVFPLFLFFLFFRNELFAVIFKHKYDASVPIFLISILILPVRINNYSSILQYYQQGNKIMYGSLLDICIAIILMISLYPLFGTRGVAMGIVISTYCQQGYYLWQSARVLHTDILSLIPIKALLILFMIMLLLFTCLYYSLFKFTIEARLITGMIATTIIIIASLVLYFTKKQLNNNGLAA
jgi:O-antigen/teichoic acid export membrane protein